MLYVEGDGLMEVALPTLVRLARQAVDKVDADVVETMPTAAVDGLNGLECVVPSVQQAEGGVVEGLDAHTDAVERQTAEHGHVVIGQVVRVGFEGNFFTGVEIVEGGQGIEDLAEIFFFELRGCAAAKIDGTDSFVFQVVATHGEFLAQGIDVAPFQVAARSGVEVTIDASCLTKRDVDIDACHVCFLFQCCKSKKLFLHFFFIYLKYWGNQMEVLLFCEEFVFFEGICLYVNF